jgi:hypothetical protein
MDLGKQNFLSGTSCLSFFALFTDAMFDDILSKRGTTPDWLQMVHYARPIEKRHSIASAKGLAGGRRSVSPEFICAYITSGTINVSGA